MPESRQICPRREMAPNNSHRLNARQIKIPRGQRVEIFLRKHENGTKAHLYLVGPATVSIVLTKTETGEKRERTQED
jgi:hypothetical protein